MLAPTRRVTVAAAVAALFTVALLASPAPAAARKRQAKKQSYVFLVTKLELGKGVPAKIEALVRKKLEEAIESHDELSAKLDADAPDPAKDPKAFEAYLARKRLRVFKVNVEITGYERTVEENDGKSGNVLTVHVALRMFGETVPQRVMAFTGDGSATIKMETGKKVRDRDDQVAHDDATELAVADAIATSLRKLSKPPKKKRRR